MSKVEALADEIGKMSPKAAGVLGEALMRALGIKVVYIQAPAPKPAPPVVEQTEFNILLEGFDPARKVGVIREVRALTGLGLIESKALVESAPKTLREEVAKAEAERIRDTLVAAGALVRLV